MNHINSGVAAYARSFGNSEKRLDEWCAIFGTYHLRQEIISLVKSLEDEICTDIVNSNRSYEGKELEAKVRKACNARDARIDPAGLQNVFALRALLVKPVELTPGRRHRFYDPAFYDAARSSIPAAKSPAR